VPFVRDSLHRITQITDPQRNQYLYTYDTNGNLASVTYPNTTQPSTYTYGANHLYLSGTDFRNDPLPTSTYYTAADTDPNGLPLNGRLASVQDALGETTSYAYNLTTNTTTVTYPANAGGNAGTATMVYDSYDSYGMLLSSTDPLGLTTANAYDVNHNLISVADPLGNVSTYTYDSNGNKTSSTYPATPSSTNTTSTTQYNQYSEPTSTIDELGNVRLFNYDSNYNPQSVTDSAGALASFQFNTNQTLAAGAIGFDITVTPANASHFTYDANGSIISRTDALGRTISYVYNSLGQKLSITEPTPTSLTGGSVSTTNYAYDQLGNLLQTAAPLSRTTSSTYDGNGNKISDTDARGNVTTYQYDALNRLVLTTYPDSTTASKTYDFRNNVVSETDQNGNVTRLTYDLSGRQVSVTRGYGTSSASNTTYAYDNAGRKISETDALSHTTAYTYDADSRLTAIAGVKGNFAYVYDNAGNRISQTDANNNKTQYQSDARKRLTFTTYPDSTTTINAYDGPGNLASVTDQADNVVQYTYDAANQLKTVVQTASPNTSNNTNSYGYDPLGNLTGLTDENLHTTTNAFDLFNEPVSKTLAVAQTETRNYDPAGNLTSLVHFNGVTTSYTYDALNRLLSSVTPSESAVCFTYTPTGKYLTSTAGDGTVNYSYDSLDRLITKATPEGILSYTYFPTGKVETITSSNANGASVAYTYDDLNRLSTVVDNRLSGNNTTTYTYDPASNVATATYPNGVQSAMTYDALNRITGLAASSSAAEISGYTYQRGPTGNLIGASELNGRTLNWTYDGIYRLTNESITSDPSQVNGSVGYQLDPVGNRLSDNSSLAGINSGSFGYSADDEVSTETYDNNGNATQVGAKSFTYDAENHLTSMSTAGTVVSVVYDAFGNRVAKTVNGVTTKYLVEDDVNPTGYPQVLDELTGGVVTRTYTYGLQRLSEDQIVNSAWTPSFYGYDGGGNVRQLTNMTDAVTDAYEYDAFGNDVYQTGSTPNNYLYRGEQYDSDLGLYYLRARYYNPLTGRFLSKDPYDGDPADLATLHKYLYANADPVDFIDANGQEALVSYNQLVVGALVLATGAAIVNYEQHKDQTEGALRELGAGISCTYNELTTLTSSWVAVGLAGNGDIGTVSRVGPCTFMANIPQNKKPPKRAKSPKPPTNPPQNPPDPPPPGCQIRIMPPSPAYPDFYPNGYWVMTCGNQPIDPSTGLPGAPWETHVPLP
jgi:RHS repeat-associated protein